MGRTRVDIEFLLEESRALEIMAEEIRQGLSASPKELPPKYFYDERGSWLFERITQLPEYYLTRAERALLDASVDDLAARAQPEELVELGAGSASKTDLLLDACRAAGRLQRYLPVEVSAAMIEHSAERLGEKYPWLEIRAVVADFEHDLGRIPPAPHRLVAFLGSTIGNLARARAVEFLGTVAALMDGDGFLVLGTDLVKDRKVLEAAYNDDQGVTAEFNRNVLRVINRRLGADFDPGAFEHVAIYDEAEARIEIYLESRVDQVARIPALDLDVRFDAGERMRTEVSCKYTRDSVERMLTEAGLALRDWFSDSNGTFALSLSAPAGSSPGAGRRSSP